MLNLKKLVEAIPKLQATTNAMAFELAGIRNNMTGRGISPADAPMIEYKLKEIENKLRMLGANPDDIVPF